MAQELQSNHVYDIMHSVYVDLEKNEAMGYCAILMDNWESLGDGLQSALNEAGIMDAYDARGVINQAIIDFIQTKKDFEPTREQLEKLQSFLEKHHDEFKDSYQYISQVLEDAIINCRYPEDIYNDTDQYGYIYHAWALPEDGNPYKMLLIGDFDHKTHEATGLSLVQLITMEREGITPSPPEPKENQKAIITSTNSDIMDDNKLDNLIEKLKENEEIIIVNPMEPPALEPITFPPMIPEPEYDEPIITM